MTAELVIDDGTTAAVRAPAAATNDSGDTVVAWAREDEYGWTDVFAQRFAWAGGAIGGQIQVNSDTWRNQEEPSIVVADIKSVKTRVGNQGLTSRSDRKAVMPATQTRSNGPLWDIKVVNTAYSTSLHAGLRFRPPGSRYRFFKTPLAWDLPPLSGGPRGLVSPPTFDSRAT